VRDVRRRDSPGEGGMSRDRLVASRWGARAGTGACVSEDSGEWPDPGVSGRLGARPYPPGLLGGAGQRPNWSASASRWGPVAITRSPPAAVREQALGERLVSGDRVRVLGGERGDSTPAYAASPPLGPPVSQTSTGSSVARARAARRDRPGWWRQRRRTAPKRPAAAHPSRHPDSAPPRPPHPSAHRAPRTHQQLSHDRSRPWGSPRRPRSRRALGGP
jgi:hypothetical protein